ncbi:hypothetical protein NM688_g3823 [Phlebia brevispora]|uniref:Uncharacterized protein n=1 Tax=Phlebia brevispora TaxID=194682 RepID=A0ACC1T4L8_9APHY|nr:hypothetical protein NM688_g3823 [Phlebia brevispora]
MAGPNYIVQPEQSGFVAALRKTVAHTPPYDARLLTLLSRLDEFLQKKDETDGHLALVRCLVTDNIQHVIADFLGNERRYRGKECNPRMLHLLYLSFKNLANLLNWIQMHPQGLSISSVDALGRKINSIHQLLWKHRLTVLQAKCALTGLAIKDPKTGTSMLNADLEKIVWFFILSCFGIFMMYCKDPFLPREAVQTIIYVWCRKPRRTERCMLILDGFMRGRSAESRGRSDIYSLCRAVTSTTEDACAFLAACKQGLRQEVVDQDLEQLLFLAHWIVLPYPDNVFIIQKDAILHDYDLFELLRGVMRSCERQLCMGTPQETEELMIIQMGLTIIGCFFLPQDGILPSYRRAVIQDNLDKLDIISFLARLTTTAVSTTRGRLAWSICNILRDHTDAVKKYEAQGRIPALRRLTYIPRDDIHCANKRTLIAAWEQYRSALGLSVADKWTAEDEATSMMQWGICASKANPSGSSGSAHREEQLAPEANFWFTTTGTTVSTTGRWPLTTTYRSTTGIHSVSFKLTASFFSRPSYTSRTHRTKFRRTMNWRNGVDIDEGSNGHSLDAVVHPRHPGFLAALKAAARPPYDAIQLLILLASLANFQLLEVKPDDYQAVLQSLASNDVQHVVADFLSDEGLYGERGREPVSLKLLALGFRILAIFCIWCHVHRQDLSASSYDALGRKACNIQRIIWKYRRIILHARDSQGARIKDPETGFSMLDDDMEADARLFLMNCYALTTNMADRKDFLVREAVQTIIYVWCLAPEIRERTEDCMEVLNSFLHDSVNGFDGDLMSIFKAVTDSEEDARALLATCIRSLHHEAVVDHTLEGMLFLMLRIALPYDDNVYMTKEAIIPSDDDWIRLLRGVLRACERQLCRGSPDGTERSITFLIGIMIISYFFTPQDPTQPPYRRAIIQNNIDKLDVIPLVAQVTTRMAVVGTTFDQFAGYVRIILMDHTEVARGYRLQGRTRALTRLASAGRRCIGPTLSALASFMPRNAQIRESKRTMIQAWTWYRASLGLSPFDKWTAEDEAKSMVWGFAKDASESCTAAHGVKSRIGKMDTRNYVSVGVARNEIEVFRGPATIMQ